MERSEAGGVFGGVVMVQSSRKGREKACFDFVPFHFYILRIVVASASEAIISPLSDINI